MVPFINTNFACYYWQHKAQKQMSQTIFPLNKTLERLNVIILVFLLLILILSTNQESL